jgi:hypothetical protein
LLQLKFNSHLFLFTYLKLFISPHSENPLPQNEKRKSTASKLKANKIRIQVLLASRNSRAKHSRATVSELTQHRAAATRTRARKISSTQTDNLAFS